LGYFQTYSEAWSAISRDIKAFPLPHAIVFIDVSPEIAHERVVMRARGELRKMDLIENMIVDKEHLFQFVKKLDLDNIIYHINGEADKSEVTNRIVQLLLGMLDDSSSKL
jgi:deoxyadenosine/deoxycytidine kinase